MRSFLIVAALALLLATPSRAVNVGDTAPDFSLSLLGEEATYQLEQMRGRVVLVDVWASWCLPCRRSLPKYNVMRNALPRNDFEVLAVNVDESASDAENFLLKNNVDYPILYDPDGFVPSLYEVIGMPTSFILDRQGVVRYIHVGYKFRDDRRIQEQIDKILEEQPASARSAMSHGADWQQQEIGFQQGQEDGFLGDSYGERQEAIFQKRYMHQETELAGNNNEGIDRRAVERGNNMDRVSDRTNSYSVDYRPPNKGESAPERSSSTQHWYRFLYD